MTSRPDLTMVRYMTKHVSGWIVFASVALGLAGVMRIFDAIWAFRYHGVLPENLEGAIFGHSLKTYGWVWLIVAALYLVCAALVLNGSQVGRWAGIFAAGVGAFSAIWWIPYYPVWSIVYIAIAGLVIQALAVHGGENETAMPTQPTPPSRVAAS